METGTLDARGRLTLPRKVRDQLQLSAGDRFTITIEDSTIRITRALPTDRAGRAAWFARAVAQHNAYLSAHPEVVEELRAEAAAWDVTLLDGLRDEPPYEDPRVRGEEDAERGSAAG
jgi:AbrB family looped-hinge helix DNA binding protein